MKGLGILALAGWLLISPSALARKDGTQKDCASVVAGRAAIYTKIWADEAVEPGFNRIADVNGILIWELANFFREKKRLPLEIELAGRLKKHLSSVDSTPTAATNYLAMVIGEFKEYYALRGTFTDLTTIFRISIVELPQVYAAIRADICKHSMSFFRVHLRPPAMTDVALKMKMSPEDLQLIAGDFQKIWEDGKQQYPQMYLDARTKVLRAFVRAAQQRDRKEYQKVQTSTPDLGEVFIALVRGDKQIQADHLSGQFTEEMLANLLGMRTNAVAVVGEGFATPQIFERGIAQAEEEARAQFPQSFKNYFSEVVYDTARAERARDAVANKNGFLITSVTAGIPLDEGQYQSMLTMAKLHNYDILILPTNGILEGMDSRLLNHPNIHVITNTIQNRALKIWQLPIMAKNQNPFASLDQRGQFVPGQLIIVGHPQLAHRIVPTGSNHLRETAHWSAGSLSKPIYPYRHAIQGRTSGLAKNYHRNGFLVVQKADRQAGPMSEGVQNYWHVRPVEYIDDTGVGGFAGFTDLGNQYRVDLREGADPEVHVSRQEPMALVMGDLHDRVADQRMLLSYRALLEQFPKLRDIYVHDPIDGGSHNHWEDEQTSLLIRKFESGELDYHREMMGLVQTSNALLSMRDNLRLVFPDSNHSYWGRKLIDKHAQTQSVVNGRFLSELTHARRTLGVEEPLEYVFRYRNQYVESLPASLRREMEANAVFVQDPRRVQVIPYGVAHVVGPLHRPVHLNFHGHQGANGARGTMRAHAAGSSNSVFGDSHQSGMMGGAMNVGTSTYKQLGYNNGGYSAWTNSFAIVYPDGTKQLLTYSSVAATFEQRAGRGVLAPTDFFGSDALQVIPTDNQILPMAEVMDTHSQWLDMLRGSLRR